MAARQRFVSPAHIGSFFSMNDRFVCWGFCSTNTPSLRDRSGDSVKRDLARSNPGTAGNRGNASVDTGTESLRSFRADKTSTPLDARRSRQSQGDEAARAKLNKHVPARSPSSQ